MTRLSARAPAELGTWPAVGTRSALARPGDQSVETVLGRQKNASTSGALNHISFEFEMGCTSATIAGETNPLTISTFGGTPSQNARSASF